jgi:DNA-binding IclR family transcriptional regulator
MRILEHLASADGPVRVSDLARSVAIAKSTCHAILRTLEQDGYVVHLTDLRWALGPRLRMMLGDVAPVDAIRRTARVVLETIVERSGWPAHLGVVDGGEVVYVDKVDPGRFVRFATYPGLRARLHLTALGKALAAYLPEEELQTALARFPLEGGTDRAIRSRSRLDTELAHVRERGYAIEWEEGEPGVCCLAAPVLAWNGRAVASLGITSLVGEMSGPVVDTTAELLQAQALRLARQLGIAQGSADGAGRARPER